MFFYGLLYMETSVLVKLQKNYIHQLWVDSGCCLEDLPRMMADRDKRHGRVNGIGAVSVS